MIVRTDNGGLIWHVTQWPASKAVLDGPVVAGCVNSADFLIAVIHEYCTDHSEHQFCPIPAFAVVILANTSSAEGYLRGHQG